MPDVEVQPEAGAEEVAAGNGSQIPEDGITHRLTYRNQTEQPITLQLRIEPNDFIVQLVGVDEVLNYVHEDTSVNFVLTISNAYEYSYQQLTDLKPSLICYKKR